MDDLISRAAAIVQLDKCVALSGIGLEPVMAVRDIKALISALPAAEAVPVVHARWQGVSPFVDSEECSHCRYNIPSDEFETPYCPWCGAKMDGERRDSE